jgi:hypothetical protein
MGRLDENVINSAADPSIRPASPTTYHCYTLEKLRVRQTAIIITLCVGVLQFDSISYFILVQFLRKGISICIWLKVLINEVENEMMSIKDF